MGTPALFAAAQTATRRQAIRPFDATRDGRQFAVLCLEPEIKQRSITVMNGEAEILAPSSNQPNVRPRLTGPDPRA